MRAGGVSGCHKRLETDLTHQVLVHILKRSFQSNSSDPFQFLGHVHSFEMEILVKFEHSHLRIVIDVRLVVGVMLSTGATNPWS